MIRGSLTFALVLVLAGSVDALAQGAPAAREILERKTRAGDRLTIDTRQGPPLEGRLVSKAADALVLDIDGREQSVPFGDMDRVRRRRNSVVLGGVIGLGAGIFFGIPVRYLVLNEHGNGNAAFAKVVVYGVGTGLLLDAAMSVNRTIYRRSAASVRFGVEPQIGGAAVRVTTSW